LGGLLALRDRVLPETLADLDRLAAAFGERVNTIVGEPLFAWSVDSPAATLAVDPGVTAESLPAESGLPPIANGIPIALAGLAHSLDPADRIDGSTFVEFYGAIGARTGELQSRSQAAATRDDALTAQARKLREEISGVSLDEEAVLILQYQRGYQAAAQMVRVIDELTESVIAMIG
jgi:flagellar hook-associated protein 1 FlgK